MVGATAAQGRMAVAYFDMTVRLIYEIILDCGASWHACVYLRLYTICVNALCEPNEQWLAFDPGRCSII